ncbi:MAG: DUF427 domain-containing protein [Gemmatimonadota bacterium]
MARAVWKGVVLAESDEHEVVEGNVYFPPDSLSRDYFQESDHQSVCPWKGLASYYDIVVDGVTNQSAAWYYPDPSEKARGIKDYVAFWKGVEVQK